MCFIPAKNEVGEEGMCNSTDCDVDRRLSGNEVSWTWPLGDTRSSFHPAGAIPVTRDPDEIDW